MPRRSFRTFVKLGALASTLLVASPALATPTFPDVAAQHLGLVTAPSCTLCHVGQTARGTVNTPFGTTMRSRGLVAYDEASLRRALDALAAEKKDSDGDGTSDIDELRTGGDPNAGASGPGGEDVIAPEYGCGVSAGRRVRDASSNGFVVASIGIAVVLARGRRRRA